MMKKSILLVACLSLLTVTLAGCSLGGGKTLSATPSPVVTFSPEAPAVTPMNTIAPAMTSAPTDGGVMDGAADNANGAVDMTGGTNAQMTPADAGRLAERIAEALERISEIDDAEVIVRDNRALVAVEFDDQYSAGLDERMKQQITETVKKEDEKITEVEITDDNTLYGEVKSLAGRIGKATGFDELADDIGDLWDRVTGR